MQIDLVHGVDTLHMITSMPGVQLQHQHSSAAAAI
jgi:hypothetical protein